MAEPMSATGLEVFDTTLQKTNQWLRELMQHLAWADRHQAYLALRATLHALRDRLNVDEAAELGAQLPMLIRGLYYEGWDPSHKPKKSRSRREFLMDVEKQFTGDTLVATEAIALAVFKVLETHVSHGEIADVRHVLPARIRELWVTAVPSARATIASSDGDRR